jgi:hypothetical protein
MAAQQQVAQSPAADAGDRREDGDSEEIETSMDARERAADGKYGDSQ